jgi:hypothetical protein
VASWLTFTRDYNWTPAEFGGASAVYFRADQTYHVVRQAAADALAANAARQATSREIDDARRRRRAQ